MSDLEAAAARIRAWKKDPVLMVREEFQVEPDHWQKEALRAFASGDVKTQRIAMKANKGPGKTALLAWLIWNFMACYGKKGHHPKGAATGITEKNLDDNLWPELSKWQQRSPFLREMFTWTKSRIFAKQFPETWWFSKRTWSKSADATQQADTLAGLHADFVLVVIDESGGVPSAIMATAEAILANKQHDWQFAKIVQAGNPTHLEGPLFDACGKFRHLWYVIEITGDPDDPNRSPRISIAWARQQIEMYGRDNPWVLVNVFGQFPPSSINSLLGPDEVNAAMRAGISEGEFTWAEKRIGVDVARFGDDRSVLFPRQGLRAFMPVTLRGARTTEIAARIMVAHENWHPQMLLVDDTGHWGHGVIDNLITVGLNPIGVQFHAPAFDNRYKNRRVEMWLKMAEWVKRGGVLPNVTELVAELTTPTYTFANGVFLLEDKLIVKERLGRSPDLADALALTFSIPEASGENFHLPASYGKSRTQVKHEYDPLEEFSK